CVGDSGYGDGTTFRRVRQRHPRLTLALLPIGAYEPRSIMRNNHMNPEEALEALELCGAERALGHHWGAFRLISSPAGFAGVTERRGQTAGLDDAYLQIADAIDVALKAITPLGGADAGGRAGEDQIAALKREQS